MEISAADETSGGGKSFNAIPELTSLALQNDDFNGEGQTLNGAVPLYNSTWTIGGMIRRGITIAALAAAAGAAWAISRKNSRGQEPAAQQPELPDSQVLTKYGILEGADEGSHFEFRGVPYAMPPVGELRWKAPQPPERWEGVRKAEVFSARCPQGYVDEQQKQPVPEGRIDYHREFYSNPEFDRADSEDCLYLNIWMPKGAKGRKLPVAVWIHGGAFDHE